MEKMKTFNSYQLSDLVNQIELHIFDLFFCEKYAYHFDRLIHELIPPFIGHPEDFTQLIDAICHHWDEPETIRFLYENTACDLLYALYVRNQFLEYHAATLKRNAMLPDSTLIEQFRFLFTDYYLSKVQTSLSELRDAYPE